MVLEKGVCYKEVSAKKRKISIEKVSLVPKNGVRYREVSAISVRYKEGFYETLNMIPSVLENSVRYREVSAIKHVRYREIPLHTVKICDGPPI